MDTDNNLLDTQNYIIKKISVSIRVYRWLINIFVSSLSILFLFLQCSNQNIVSTKPHHTKDGFINMDKSILHHGFGSFLKWQLDRVINKMPSKNPLDYNIESTKNDGIVLNENKSQFSATWIGHATTLIQIDGVNILTDPIWSERCSPVSFAGPKRFTDPGIDFDQLPEINIVLISHNHYDHMDIPTLKKLNDTFQPTFFVGLKNKKFLEENGIVNVIEKDWWEETSVKGLKIVFTPTQHFSARTLWDRNETLWGSYVIIGKKNSFYFAGDTGYFNGFSEIGERYPNIQLAILPIGAYEPRWFMKSVHMNPDDAILSFKDLNAKYMLPIHYNTFILTDEPLDEPLKLTKEIFSKEIKDLNRLIDLKIGESRFF